VSRCSVSPVPDNHLHETAEAIPAGDFPHVEVDARVVMTGEADLFDLGAVLGENAIGIFEP
jgi:hypothetical protein